MIVASRCSLSQTTRFPRQWRLQVLAVVVFGAIGIPPLVRAIPARAGRALGDLGIDECTPNAFDEEDDDLDRANIDVLIDGGDQTTFTAGAGETTTLTWEITTTDGTSFNEFLFRVTTDLSVVTTPNGIASACEGVKGVAASVDHNNPDNKPTMEGSMVVTGTGQVTIDASIGFTSPEDEMVLGYSYQQVVITILPRAGTAPPTPAPTRRPTPAPRRPPPVRRPTPAPRRPPVRRPPPTPFPTPEPVETPAPTDPPETPEPTAGPPDTPGPDTPGPDTPSPTLVPVTVAAPTKAPTTRPLARPGPVPTVSNPPNATTGTLFNTTNATRPIPSSAPSAFATTNAPNLLNRSVTFAPSAWNGTMTPIPAPLTVSPQEAANVSASPAPTTSAPTVETAFPTDSNATRWPTSSPTVFNATLVNATLLNATNDTVAVTITSAPLTSPNATSPNAMDAVPAPSASNSNPGLVAGLVVGITVLVIVVGGLVWILVQRSNTSAKDETVPETAPDTVPETEPETDTAKGKDDGAEPGTVAQTGTSKKERVKVDPEPMITPRPYSHPSLLQYKDQSRPARMPIVEATPYDSLAVQSADDEHVVASAVAASHSSHWRSDPEEGDEMPHSFNSNDELYRK